MATDAVCLQDLFAVFRYLDPLGRQTGKEETHVLHSVYRLPDVVDDHIIVGQMAVNAFFSPVRPSMRPCLKFRFHDMAAPAENRSLGLCEKLWRPQQQEEKYRSSHNYKNGKIPNNLFGFFSAHISAPISEDRPGIHVLPFAYPAKFI